MSYDDVIGTMFMSPEIAKLCRYDNEIDWHESIDEDDEVNGLLNIRYLNKSIFSYEGYIYNGGLDAETEENYELVPGRKNEYYCHFHMKSIQKLLDNGIFSIYQDDIVYFGAKLSGALKPNITKEQFKKAVKPAIITSWA